MSQYTSLVAIEKREEATEGTLISIPVNDILDRTAATSGSKSDAVDMMDFEERSMNAPQKRQMAWDVFGSRESAQSSSHEPTHSVLDTVGSSVSSVVTELGSAFGDVKNSVSNFFNFGAPSRPQAQAQPQQQQRQVLFDALEDEEDEEDSYVVLFLWILFCCQNWQQKRIHKKSTTLSLFRDTLFGEAKQEEKELYFRASSPVSTASVPSVPIDPNATPFIKIIMSQQSDGSWNAAVLPFLTTKNVAMSSEQVREAIQLFSPHEELFTLFITVVTILCI